MSNLQLHEIKDLYIEDIHIFNTNSNYSIAFVRTKRLPNDENDFYASYLITQKNKVRYFKTLDSAYKISNLIFQRNIVKTDHFKLQLNPLSIDRSLAVSDIVRDSFY